MIADMPKARTAWAKRLEALRARMGLTQEKFVKELGIGLRTYRAFIYGERSPTDTLKKLVALLEEKHS